MQISGEVGVSGIFLDGAIMKTITIKRRGKVEQITSKPGYTSWSFVVGQQVRFSDGGGAWTVIKVEEQL